MRYALVERASKDAVPGNAGMEGTGSRRAARWVADPGQAGYCHYRTFTKAVGASPLEHSQG